MTNRKLDSWDWTQEREDKLSKLWAMNSPRLSAQEIANEMNRDVPPGEYRITRNAVLGKVHRLGLPLRERPIAAGKPRGPRVPPGPLMQRKRNPMRMADLDKPSDQFVLPIPRNIPFMKLKNHHCRAVVGKDEDGLTIYCGIPRVDGYSYCQGHCEVYYDRQKKVAPVPYVPRAIGGGRR